MPRTGWCSPTTLTAQAATALHTPIKHLTAGFARVLAAAFSRGQDPASVAAKDRLALDRALREARPAADLIIDKAVEPYLARLDNAEARVCALHAATRAIAHLGTGDVSRQVARLSKHLDFPTATVTRDVLDALDRIHTRPHRRQRAAYPQATRSSSEAAPRADVLLEPVERNPCESNCRPGPRARSPCLPVRRHGRLLPRRQCPDGSLQPRRRDALARPASSASRARVRQRLATVEHLLDDLADTATELSEHLTLRAATDLVRDARTVRLSPEVIP